MNHLTQILDVFRSLTSVRDVSMIGAAFSSCQSKREDPLPSIQAVFECVNEMPIVSPPSPTQCVQGIELLLSGDSYHSLRYDSRDSNSL